MKLKHTVLSQGTKNKWSFTDGTWIKQEIDVKDDSVDQRAALKIKQVTELKEDSIDIKKQEEVTIVLDLHSEVRNFIVLVL
jgi:DNA polymerase III alpha subunit (gram-positive type)